MDKKKIQSLQLFKVGNKFGLMDMQVKKMSEDARGIYKVMFQITNFGYHGNQKYIDKQATFYFDIHTLALLADDIVSYRFEKWNNRTYTGFRGKSGNARHVEIVANDEDFIFIIEEGTAKNPKDNVAELDRSKPVIFAEIMIPMQEVRESFKSVSDFITAFSNSTYVQDNIHMLGKSVFHRWLIAEYEISSKS